MFEEKISLAKQNTSALSVTTPCGDATAMGGKKGGTICKKKKDIDMPAI
jgi:hypothetical protein